MPRSAAKSQADKRTPKQSIQVNTPPITPPPAQSQLRDTLSKKDADETVAEGMEELKSKAMEGCLPPLTPAQSQLMDMLSKEHTDETVDKIMEELMSKVMEGCLKVDIERQLVPFTASWAKSYLTKILERQILCPDGGEEPEESLRTEDSEPLPAILDAWVQGCVPIEADIDQIPAQTEPKVNQVCNVMAQTNISLKQSEKETTPKKPVINKVLSPRPPPKIDLKKKQQVNLTPKPVAGKLLPPLPYSAGKKEVGKEREDRTHSVCNYSTESLYQHNNKQPTTKLDPSSLPRYCIFPQYEIIDDNHKKPNSKKTSGLSKHEPRYVKQREQLNSSKDQPAKGRNEADVWLKKLPPQGKERMVSSGPLRLDTMVLAKGVSLVDPQAVEISPLRCNLPTLSTKLRPIQSVAAVPMFSVDQFTTGQPPRVIPLLKSKNPDN